MKKNLLSNGIEIVSMDAGIARVNLRSRFSAPDVAASEALKLLIAKLSNEAAAKLWGIPVEISGSQTNKSDNFNFQKVADVLPRSEDYISVKFRALSKTIVPGHWIDWSKDDVLKNSLPKLLGQTVYPNHDFTDINNWLGSVASVSWDEEGAQSDGVPGINAEYKIDALMNPRIARGLLMSPPAIHSTSMTVLFKFEYSHPEIAAENRWRFFDLLGEEVEGEIVRLIVTEILEYWEASLVFQGADRLAKKQEEEDFAGMSAKADEDPAAEIPPPSSNQEKTMKLNQEQKTKLGIECDGEDVPETEIFKAADSFADRLEQFKDVDPTNIAQLQAQADAGKKYIDLQRAKVVKQAKLAELGANEGDLPNVIKQQIAAADFDTLVELENYYNGKVAEKFPEIARSSQENPKAVENAGGVDEEAETVPEVGVL